MNVEQATMQVDRWKARSAYFEYRELVKLGRGTKQDDELRRAYREISQGAKVIDINLAIASGGLNADGLPHLAIARADWPFVSAWYFEQKVVFSRTNPRWLSPKGIQQVASHNIRVDVGRPGGSEVWQVAGKAQVPMIPPPHRPKGDISGYRILFEAVWERQPPVDPILLRHIGGPFYVVLAQWDLSPLEQAVLRAKL